MIVEYLAADVLMKNPGSPFCFDCLAQRAAITAPGHLVWLKALWGSKWKDQVQRRICAGCAKRTETIQRD